MPELPEVETIRRGLDKFIKKRKLCGVKVFCEKSFVGDSGLVLGAQVSGLGRRGKALLIDFDNGYTLMVHLRMTGQLIWRRDWPASALAASDASVLAHRTPQYDSLRASALPSNRSTLASSRLAELRDEEYNFAGGHPSDNFEAELPNKQTRVELDFEGGVLYFNDQRKFGFIKVLATGEVEKDAFIAGLGLEPWQMDVKTLSKKIACHGKSPVKALLLDQKVMAGLGNIYADETCYFAGVKPDRKCEDLSAQEIEKLLCGARETMERSIEAGGSTMATYRKADGTKGDYLEKFAEVFHREGQECRRCGGKIVKTRVAGRGTHYCPGCQK